MDNLERRYRRLLRLLPADHRAARGAELLGMLLDLDGARTVPSIRQTAGLLGLAIRLRLADSASMLLAAFLVAIGTAISAFGYDLVTGNVTIIGSAGWLPITVNLALPNLLRLATAAAWILGARRTALAASVAVLVSDLVRPGLGAAPAQDLVVLAVLSLAVWSRWPAPRPRIALLATIPFGFLLWILIAIWRQDGVPAHASHPHPAAWTLTLAGMIGATIIAGLLARHRSRRTTLALLTAGAIIGAITPSVLPWLLYHGLSGGTVAGSTSLFLIVTLAVALSGALCRAFGTPTQTLASGSPPPLTGDQ